MNRSPRCRVPRRAAPLPRRSLVPLEEPYRSRAAPPGTARYWSWLFAAPAQRAPLLGVYALGAEWQALQDPEIDLNVAHIKLAWWREELQRMSDAAPVHPITRHLAGMPGAHRADWAALGSTVAAAAAHVSGVPLERAAELPQHADDLYGAPLRLAAVLSGLNSPGLAGCTRALAAGQYLLHGLRDHAREARAGRMVFAVDELLAAGIETADLVAERPPPRLETYLDGVRMAADRHFRAAARALQPSEQPLLRHLVVLAALGSRRAQEHARRGTWGPDADFRLADMYHAWSAARRAAAAR